MNIFVRLFNCIILIPLSRLLRQPMDDAIITPTVSEYQFLYDRRYMQRLLQQEIRKPKPVCVCVSLSLSLLLRKNQHISKTIDSTLLHKL